MAVSVIENGIETYKAIAVSTSHLSPDDVYLFESVVSAHSTNMLTKRDTGFFLKLYGERENDQKEEYSPSLNLIISRALASNALMIEFDADASIVDGVPRYDGDYDDD
jgi:hypothetical protein